MGTPDNRPPLSAPQFESMVWADASAQVYALVLGRVVGELPECLAAADASGQLRSWDCLWPGALTPAQRRQAPYLLQLEQKSAFTSWLLHEAAADFGDWGLLIQARRDFLALRSHCRANSRARLPDGQEIALEWMDPAVLRALLPLAPGEQVETLLAPFERVLIPGTTGWTLIAQHAGRLELHEQPLLAAAA